MGRVRNFEASKLPHVNNQIFARMLRMLSNKVSAKHFLSRRFRDAPTWRLCFRAWRFRAEDLYGADFAVATSEDGNAAELVSVSLVTIL